MGARRGWPVAAPTQYDLDNVFSYHKPSQGDIVRHATIRDAARVFAEVVLTNTGPGREQALALTAVEIAMFWANASVAREPDDE